MSNMRSASSKTRYVTRRHVQAFILMRSIMRPGVHTATYNGPTSPRSAHASQCKLNAHILGLAPKRFSSSSSVVHVAVHHCKAVNQDAF